jgi:glucosamine--fructose-6-phosphate aminotransferase (isomerizing)
MSGLVGAVAARDVMPMLLDGLHRLEYRHYDSAGLALVDSRAPGLSVHRCVGRLADLEQVLHGEPLASSLGIAHVRSATCGEPAEHNAHPQVSHHEIAVVHNGTIRNYGILRAMLQAKGYEFSSDTDTEAIAHLIHHYRRAQPSLFEAVQAAVRELRGRYAIAVVAASEPERLIVACEGRPLAIGVNVDELFVASDAAALQAWTQRIILLERGDVAELKRDDISIVDADGAPVIRALHTAEAPQRPAGRLAGRLSHWAARGEPGGGPHL